MTKKIDTSKEKIKQLLTRGVDEVIDYQDLEKKLLSGKQLRVKLGIDPTSPNIHIGRSIPLLKLRDFQELGHQLVFIVGDFTGVIGDTSDKTSERPMLDEATIQTNIKSYVDQAKKIIDIDQCEVHYNSEWLDKLRYRELSKQANEFSINEFISRDNIRRRLESGTRVSLREVLYPLMQGYDSVELKADVEIGGTDQRFNLLAGRQLQRMYGQEPQNIITGPLVEGLDGRKMSSSWGNTINLFETPRNMFGKVMSLKDEYVIKYFTLVTRVSLEEIAKMEKQLAEGANPRDIKILLAKELVTFYHSAEAAAEEEAYFFSTFSKKEIPDQMPEFTPSSPDLLTILVETKMVASKSEARRVIEQGGVKVNQEVIKDLNYVLKADAVVQKGKMHFFQIKIK